VQNYPNYLAATGQDFTASFGLGEDPYSMSFMPPQLGDQNASYLGFDDFLNFIPPLPEG